MDEGILIWLRSIGSSELDEKILKDNVQKFIHDIPIFDNIDECIQNLLSIYEEKVFIRLGYELSYLVNILNDFNQIQYIYIYLSEPLEYKGNVKVRSVFNDNIELFKQFEKDINFWKNRHIYLTFCDVDCRRMETTTQDIENHTARFMWSQMLLETLLNVPSPLNNPHKDLIEEARRLYANNQFSLDIINEFEREYQAKDAIKWYTRDSFLYRLVNKALRTRDICLIFKFRFLIQHIYKQLKDEQQKTLTDMHLKLPLTLYRGQLMTTDEFDQLEINTNKLISINTFLSTTPDCQIANIFSGEDSSHSNLISVVFEILIDSTCDISCLPPFANINNLSYMKDEDEILLSMSTVMKIVSVIKINQMIGKVYLRMCRHDDLVVGQMKTYLSKEILKLQSNESSHIHQLGTMLFYMGENKKAEQMFNMVPMGENALDDALRPLFIFVARLAEQILVTDDPESILRSEFPKFSSILQDLINNHVIPDLLRPIIHGATDSFIIVCEQFDRTNGSSYQQNQFLEQYVEFIYILGSLIFPSTHPTMIHIYILF